MVPLRADLALRRHALRPVHDQAVAGAAVVGGDLLGPRERRVARHRPARGHVRVGGRPAPVVVVLEHVRERLLHAVEVRHLAEHAVHAALGARAVVAQDVEDERVVELPDVADGVHQPADLGVGVLAEAGVDLHLAGEELLLVGAESAPVLDRLGLRRKLRPGRHDAEVDLAREGLLAHHVPARVEPTLVLRDPLLRRVVRGVRRARREVHEEGLVRRQRLLELHPGDRLVRHVRHEVIVRVSRDLDRVHAVVEVRRPLVGLAAEEAVELVEPGPCRPAVGRARRADLPGRRLVVLAEEAGAVAVQPQHLGERRDVVRALPRVARKRGRCLGDATHVVHVVVTAAEQRRPRRRADRRRVELVVAQPRLGQAVGRRHVDRPPERARDAEAHVVDQHDQDVRRPVGRFHLEARRRRGLAGIELGLVRVVRLPDRQHRAVKCGGRGCRGRGRLGGRRLRPRTGHRDQQSNGCRGRQRCLESLESHHGAPLGLGGCPVDYFHRPKLRTPSMGA